MKLHKKIARRFGYELISSKKNHITIEGHLSALFRLLEIDCVLDVGANVGQYALQLRAQGYKKHIFSFEPVKATYDILSERAKNDPLWHVYPFALGSKEETKTLHIPPDSSMASFLPINDYAKERYQERIANPYQEIVTIKTLDSFWDLVTTKVQNPKVYLKMDTQGYDLEVLDGAHCSIKKILGLQSELSLIPIYDHIPNYITVLERCRLLGFEITGIYPVSRDLPTLKIVEFDCVMVRGQLRGSATSIL